MKNLFSLIAQANSMRFKLLGVVGHNEEKKEKIINILANDGWILIDVEKELIELREKIERSLSDQDLDIELSSKIKEWFHSKPDKLILSNASILYHEAFMKTSPIGAFKYNSRNKSCIIFLEDEKKMGHRLYYGDVGSPDYKDQEVYDILLEEIDNIDENSVKINNNTENYANNLEDINDPIKNYFNFHTIKDVVDIDNDLKDIDKKRYIVENYIVSESLEEQIINFFDDLEKPNHKSRNVIGNYGSGKSHLVGFLVSLVEHKKLFSYIRNEKIKNKLKDFDREFFTVHFELQANQTELRRWFFEKVRKQLKEKYNISIPKFDLKEQFDDKENIQNIMKIVKEKNPENGLLVVIDEVSDFLLAKPKEFLRQDLQFLRVLGQVTQDEDIMFICSMQEDIFSSPKFKDVAEEITRVRERFQNIIIHKEDIEKVISERIVPKTEEQKLNLEEKLQPYMEKINEVSRNIDKYISLFPLTPSLIDYFNTLPYFEKRGVIQFSMDEIKRNLNKPFPFFLTFEKIYDILSNDPNRKNIPEIYDVVKTMEILFQKLELLDEKYKTDAVKLVKGLAVAFLREEGTKGITPEELANNLLLIAKNKTLTPSDYVIMLAKRIRELTDGEYIKVDKDENTKTVYIRFDTKKGIDPDEKIAQKVDTISDDEIEEELFHWLQENLELYTIEQNIYEDECIWKSKKSFKKGKLIFQKKYNKFSKRFDKEDYLIVLISPFFNGDLKQLHDHQLNIKLKLKSTEAIVQLKEIVAIKKLIQMGFQKNAMERRLKDRLDGFQKGDVTITGFNYRFYTQFKNFAECEINGEKFNIDSKVNVNSSFYQVFEDLKSEVFDPIFNSRYSLHPKYPVQITSKNIIPTLDTYWNEISKEGIGTLSVRARDFLKSIELVDSENFPSCVKSPICEQIKNLLKENSDKLTIIEEDIVEKIMYSDFGLEREIVYFILAIMTLLGETVLKQVGGKEINIDNISHDLKSIASFESVKYIALHKKQSLDFASTIIKVFNLNGEKILIESERNKIFREYKEKVDDLLNKLNAIENKIDVISSEPKIYIQKKDLDNLFEDIKLIDWEEFNLKNINGFSKLQKYYDKIGEIKEKISIIDNLFKALEDYDNIKLKIIYMENALELLENSGLFDELKLKIKEIKKLYEETLATCQKLDDFLNVQNRVMINGKFDKFQNTYIKEIYYPTHEQYVGKLVNWDKLDEVLKSETYKSLLQISKITKQINDIRFKELRNKIEDVRRIRCANENLLIELKTTPRCQKCSFPKDNEQYEKVKVFINNIEETFENLKKDYEDTLLKGIKEYIDNIQFLENEKEKNFIENILRIGHLPDRTLTDEEISTINKLFKEIDIITVKKSEILDKIFPNSNMVSVEKLKENFNQWIENITHTEKVEQIRLKLED